MNDFNLDQALLEKARGMALVATNQKDRLRVARRYAELAATRLEYITADDVRELMLKSGVNPDPLGNGWGSVFKGGSFEFAGRYKPSTRVSNHGRLLYVWRLKREAVTGDQQ